MTTVRIVAIKTITFGFGFTVEIAPIALHRLSIVTIGAIGPGLQVNNLCATVT
jgi:hypothetical protein